MLVPAIGVMLVPVVVWLIQKIYYAFLLKKTPAIFKEKIIADATRIYSEQGKDVVSVDLAVVKAKSWCCHKPEVECRVIWKHTEGLRQNSIKKFIPIPEEDLRICSHCRSHYFFHTD